MRMRWLLAAAFSVVAVAVLGCEDAVPYVIAKASGGGGSGGSSTTASSSTTISSSPSSSVPDCTGSSKMAPAVAYTLGSHILAVAAADFDGDGKPDLAATEGVSGDVVVLLNRGGGTFVESHRYLVGPNPFAIAVLDANGDGLPDLAVTWYGLDGGYVSLLMNASKGAFLPNIQYPTGTSTMSVAAFDLNSDGKTDLVAGAFGDRTAVALINEGYGAEFALQVIQQLAANPTSVSILDANGDGVPDVAVANGSNVSVLLNAGQATFSTARDYPAGTAPSAIQAADFDGDGRVDLAFVDDTVVGVLRNEGNGTFGAASTYPIGATGGGMAAADLNGDGKLDLAVAQTGGGSVLVLPNRGDGTFGRPAAYPAGASPHSVAAADFDGDGKLDLAVAADDGTVQVLINRCP